MNKKTRILSDFSRIASDAFGTIVGLRKEIETMVRIRVEKFINNANLVKRDEFEVLKKMVENISKKNKNIEKKVKVLKSKTNKPRNKNKKHK